MAPGTFARVELRGAHTESAEHLIATTGDGRTFELNGGDQFADELIELCQRLNAGWLLVRRAALLRRLVPFPTRVGPRFAAYQRLSWITITIYEELHCRIGVIRLLRRRFRPQRSLSSRSPRSGIPPPAVV